MHRVRARLSGLALAVALVLSVLAVPADAEGAGATTAALTRSPELSETTRLADRRAVVIGDRLYATSTADGLYPAMGFHTRGEMGGFWAPPITLLDGVWFSVHGRLLGAGVPAHRFTSGWGYHRTTYAPHGGVTVRRTDVVPDDVRAGLIGLTARHRSTTRCRTRGRTSSAAPCSPAATSWAPTSADRRTPP